MSPIAGARVPRVSYFQPAVGVITVPQRLMSPKDLLYNSYIDNKGEKTYHFWLLSEWGHDGGSQQRGMDRFTFKPGIGVTSASYDFFVPIMFDYWSGVYLKKLAQPAQNTIIHAADE